jgi:hypothetical protein
MFGIGVIHRPLRPCRRPRRRERTGERNACHKVEGEQPKDVRTAHCLACSATERQSSAAGSRGPSRQIAAIARALPMSYPLVPVKSMTCHRAGSISGQFQAPALQAQAAPPPDSTGPPRKERLLDCPRRKSQRVDKIGVPSQVPVAGIAIPRRIGDKDLVHKVRPAHGAAGAVMRPGPAPPGGHDMAAHL